MTEYYILSKPFAAALKWQVSEPKETLTETLEVLDRLREFDRENKLHCVYRIVKTVPFESFLEAETNKFKKTVKDSEKAV